MSAGAEESLTALEVLPRHCSRDRRDEGCESLDWRGPVDVTVSHGGEAIIGEVARQGWAMDSHCRSSQGSSFALDGGAPPNVGG